MHHLVLEDGEGGVDEAHGGTNCVYALPPQQLQWPRSATSIKLPVALQRQPDGTWLSLRQHVN
jgi:hypothetical protein